MHKPCKLKENDKVKCINLAGISWFSADKVLIVENQYTGSTEEQFVNLKEGGKGYMRSRFIKVESNA